MAVTQARRTLGRRGEEVAAEVLRRRGWRILARNYRCPLGELDLVAEDGDVVVFVEVKTRRGLRAGSAAEAVGPGKRRRLLRLARYFLAVHGLTGRACRFDVVCLTVAPGRARVAVLRDAFAGETW